MTDNEQGDRLTLEMTREDYERLILYLGIAAGTQGEGHENRLYDIRALLSRMSLKKEQGDLATASQAGDEKVTLSNFLQRCDQQIDSCKKQMLQLQRQISRLAEEAKHREAVTED